jgi:hypothetical protein
MAAMCPGTGIYSFLLPDTPPQPQLISQIIEGMMHSYFSFTSLTVFFAAFLFVYAFILFGFANLFLIRQHAQCRSKMVRQISEAFLSLHTFPFK